MKKSMTMIVRLLIWALVGFLSATAVLKLELGMDFTAFAYPIAVVLAGLSAALIVYAGACYIAIKRTASENLNGEEEDEAEGRMYRRFADANLSATLAMLFSLTAVSVAGITEQPFYLVIVGGLLTVLSFITLVLLPGLMNTMYPERNIPSINDKKYAEKLLEVSDDGERHVMLNGLYKTYSNLNVLLIGAVVILFVYSVGTGTSQLFSIFVVVAILAVTNTQYIVKIRNK